MTEKAIKERSSILQMKKRKCPVLILHSETDEDVPVSQAYLLRDRLTELKKGFEIRISPVGKHGFMDGEFVSVTIDFLSRRLKGTPANTNSGKQSSAYAHSGIVLAVLVFSLDMAPNV